MEISRRGAEAAERDSRVGANSARAMEPSPGTNSHQVAPEEREWSCAEHLVERGVPAEPSVWSGGSRPDPGPVWMIGGLVPARKTEDGKEKRDGI